MSQSVKDLFSGHADMYARYRPLYPAELYEFIFSHVEERIAALDCGTGNGQCAVVLADYFQRVDATDISDKQIAHAVRKPNLHYHVCPVEKMPFHDNSFDLVTCATAVHWFQFDPFYSEIRRVSKNNAVFACWAYDLLRTDHAKVNELIDEYYWKKIHSYWDPERGYVDAQYKTIPFPFEEIANPGFATIVNWNLETLEGFLNTWSAVQHYIRQNNMSPVPALMEDIKTEIGAHGTLRITFPIFMRIGKLKK